MGKERLRALAISLVVISTVPALAQMTGWVNIIPEGPGIRGAAPQKQPWQSMARLRKTIGSYTGSPTPN